MRASRRCCGPRRRPIQKLRIMPSRPLCQTWASGSPPSPRTRGRRCAGGGRPSAARRRTNLNEGRSCGGGAARCLVCFHARRRRAEGTQSTPSTPSTHFVRTRRGARAGPSVDRAGRRVDEETRSPSSTRPAPRRASIKPGGRVSTASPSSSSTRSWTGPAQPPRSRCRRKRNAKRRRAS